MALRVSSLDPEPALMCERLRRFESLGAVRRCSACGRGPVSSGRGRDGGVQVRSGRFAELLVGEA